MTKHAYARFISFLFLFAVLSAAVPAGSQPPPVTISGKITGASGNHRIYIALWDAAGFLNKPAQQVLIDAHGNAAFQFKVPPGAWAISAYEDENDNGKLDMGIFGPREPSGFWRAFHGWHKPRFNEVSSTVSADIPNADVELRK
jgi:uncharacterized protein (DUF2141 family)